MSVSRTCLYTCVEGIVVSTMSSDQGSVEVAFVHGVLSFSAHPQRQMRIQKGN